MKIFTDKKYEAEIRDVAQRSFAEGKHIAEKGYYSNENNELNEYLKYIAHQLNGQLQFAPIAQVSRDEIKRLYEQSAVLRGIVSKIARSVGEVFPYLELVNRRSGEVDYNHPLNKLLARPNDRYTLQDIGEAAFINYGLFGDTWAYCPKGVGLDINKASELYIVPSHKLAVKTGTYEEIFQGIELRGDFAGKNLSKDTVFEVFDYNLDDTSFFGLSKVAAAAVYLSVIDKSMRREDTALHNGGPASIITPANTTMPALKEDKDSLEQEMNGDRAFGKNKVLRLPVEVHQLGNKPVDLDILDSHDKAVQVLCFLYELPVDLYLGQAKYENAREAKKQLYENNAIPFANKWGRALLSFLGLARDYELRVNTDNIDILHDNPYDVAQKMSQIGAFSTNEIRQAAGWDKRDEAWADEVRLPLGVQIGVEPIDIDEE